MQVEISDNTEKLIMAGLVSGEFRSAEEAVAAMARVWADTKLKQGESRLQLNPSTDIIALAAEQGVRPFNSDTAPAELWPKDELVDDFLKFLEDVRRDARTPRDPQE